MDTLHCLLRGVRTVLLQVPHLHWEIDVGALWLQVTLGSTVRDRVLLPLVHSTCSYYASAQRVAAAKLPAAKLSTYGGL